MVLYNVISSFYEVLLRAGRYVTTKGFGLFLNTTKKVRCTFLPEANSNMYEYK